MIIIENGRMSYYEYPPDVYVKAKEVRETRKECTRLQAIRERVGMSNLYRYLYREEKGLL